MQAGEVSDAPWGLSGHADVDEGSLYLTSKRLVRRPQAVQALVKACKEGVR